MSDDRRETPVSDKRTTNERPDLTALIERLNGNPVGDDGMLFDKDTLSGAERDEIVLALRERRVMRHPSTLWAAFYDEHGVMFQIRDSDGGEALRALDEAEHILGYGGSDD